MKRVFSVLVVLAICVVGFGFYRGWFTLSSPSPAEGSNEVNLNLATDTDKIKEDAQTVKDKAAELTGKVTEDPEMAVDQSTDNVPPAQLPPDNTKPKPVEP